jgi:hypothetical protein
LAECEPRDEFGPSEINACSQGCREFAIDGYLRACSHSVMTVAKQEPLCQQLSVVSFAKTTGKKALRASGVVDAAKGT